MNANLVKAGKMTKVVRDTLCQRGNRQVDQPHASEPSEYGLRAARSMIAERHVKTEIGTEVARFRRRGEESIAAADRRVGDLEFDAYRRQRLSRNLRAGRAGGDEHNECEPEDNRARHHARTRGRLRSLPRQHMRRPNGNNSRVSECH